MRILSRERVLGCVILLSLMRRAVVVSAGGSAPPAATAATDDDAPNRRIRGQLRSAAGADDPSDSSGRKRDLFTDDYGFDDDEFDDDDDDDDDDEYTDDRGTRREGIGGGRDRRLSPFGGDDTFDRAEYARRPV
ncbi:unnamed protein product [Vitrella brassicaformis CCMP3155]|uniref:Secreted protein n=1 Tax=Vitrella brassicaformis (strain CCMP3155) TaxID=1169540 RepID=A0A0G4H311_VITBC|nr:unnamed protein product [Vitrella brassicaformis CCMP3155]|mmetsp:Transcript_12769/g.37083  ORF Transcript_12769/g.37083 Transcript_12769/m.37083 type:complete len:134 (-) Transcript_12769:1302-1703(-)|eukprot:CEM37820.1 unnamed protein product [Vitrella brassicaformis CCMP3155]